MANRREETPPPSPQPNPDPQKPYRRYPPPKERNLDRDEDTEGELLIRIHDKFMDLVNEDEDLEEHYNTIFEALTSIMRDELEDFAFDYAYSLFSQDRVCMRNRAERAERERELLRELENETLRPYTKKRTREMEDEKKAGTNPGRKS